MTRDTWEQQFTHLLQQQLGITPEQVNFCWKQYYSQRYTPESAIAHLIEIHRLMPTRGVLPQTATAET